MNTYCQLMSTVVLPATNNLYTRVTRLIVNLNYFQFYMFHPLDYPLLSYVSLPQKRISWFDPTSLRPKLHATDTKSYRKRGDIMRSTYFNKFTIIQIGKGLLRNATGKINKNIQAHGVLSELVLLPAGRGRPVRLRWFASGALGGGPRLPAHQGVCPEAAGARRGSGELCRSRERVCV